MSQNFISFYGCIKFHCYLYYILLIHSPVGGYSGGFYFLGIVNYAGMSTAVQPSVRLPAFQSFVIMHRSGIAGSRGTL